MVNIALQLWVTDGPTPEAIKQAADAGYDGVEFAFEVEEHDPAAVRAALEETGLTVAGAHVSIDQLREKFDWTVDFYQQLGCDTIVIPYLDDAHFEDTNAVAEIAAEMNNISSELQEHGFGLGYHNHDHEFHDVGGLTALEALAAELDESIEIELDIRHAARAGVDPLPLVTRLADRLSILHVADVDVDAAEPVPIGEGDVDVSACLAEAIDDGIEWIVYEDGPDVEGFSSAAQAIRSSIN